MRGLDLFGLTGYFDFLIGSDDWPEHKPHPGPVAHGCERLGLAPQTCLYVGDSPSTCSREAARAAPPRRRYGVCSLRSCLKRSSYLRVRPRHGRSAAAWLLASCHPDLAAQDDSLPPRSGWQSFHSSYVSAIQLRCVQVTRA